jgi:hypothetical protein
MTSAQHANENLTLHFKVKDFNAWRTSYQADADLIIRFANRTVAENGQGSILDARIPWSAAGWPKVSPNGPAAKSSRRAATKGHRVLDVDCP